LYDLAITTASDAITLSYAENGITEIQNVVVCNNGAQYAAFTATAVSFSGLVVTITSVEEDGSASTEWTDATVNLLIVGK